MVNRSPLKRRFLLFMRGAPVGKIKFQGQKDCEAAGTCVDSDADSRHGHVIGTAASRAVVI
jgi:hypothetical protein